MSVISKLNKIDRRWWWAIVTVLIAIPLVYPLGLPIPIDPQTRYFYQTIQDLPQGAPVILILDFESGLVGELQAQGVDTLKHVVDKHLTFIQITFYRADCATIFRTKILPLVDMSGYTYGTDWVDMGFVTGGETAIKSFAANFLFPQKDWNGVDLAGMPIFNKMKSAADAKACIAIEAGLYDQVLRQITVPYKVPTVEGNGLVNVPDMYQYYQAGVLKGILGGLPGAAQYEFLLGKPGLAIRGMDSLSTSQVFMLIGIVVLNVAYVLDRSGKKTQPVTQGGKPQ